MCRAHCVIVAATVTAWAGALALMFVPLVATGDGRSLAMLAAVNLGALAACLTTVAVLPYLLDDLYGKDVADHVATFLAGVAVGQQHGAPTEATRRTPAMH